MTNDGDAPRELSGLVVPQRGSLEATGDVFVPYRLVDVGGAVVVPASAFFAELAACGRPATTQRSYGMDLLRWFRFVWAVGVDWDQATRVEARDFCRWLQVTREVAALSLADLDWRAGQIVVHGKGRRVDRLPLPVDVGEAIAGYLRRGRPRTTRREVFLRTTAPRAGLSHEAVSWIVRRACARAGVAPVGAHRLRHTLACEMVRAGVPLPEISAVLRHRAGASTTIYARVDVDQLRGLARPWPAGIRR